LVPAPLKLVDVPRSCELTRILGVDVGPTRAAADAPRRLYSHTFARGIPRTESVGRGCLLDPSASV